VKEWAARVQPPQLENCKTNSSKCREIKLLSKNRLELMDDKDPPSDPRDILLCRPERDVLFQAPFSAASKLTGNVEEKKPLLTIMRGCGDNHILVQKDFAGYTSSSMIHGSSSRGEA